MNAINSQNFHIIYSNELRLYFVICVESLVYWISLKKWGFYSVVHLWQVFWKHLWLRPFSCSFVAGFLETSMAETIFCQVGGCYFIKYKLHRRCLMAKFSEILIMACRKIFCFYPILHETNPIAAVSLMYLRL